METAVTNIPEIGAEIAQFSRLRCKGYIYVDKTDFVNTILTTPRPRLFLSRPRRFGKTLLIDTLEEAAVGRKELFSGLKIDRLRGDIKWPRSHVLRISMNSFGDDPSLLDKHLTAFLHSFAAERGFSIVGQNSAYSLFEVISALQSNYADIPIVTKSIKAKDRLMADQSEIIVLIDEYDAPIINNLTDSNKIKLAKETLHSFYNSLKSCENMIDRVFITGITKFSQLSVFSAMNNLRDITFQYEYANICGFTFEEIEQCYNQHLDKVLAFFQNDKEFGTAFTREMFIKRIEDWYDGYSWNGKEYLINPVSLQNLLIDRKFDNFWIKSGGTNFLNVMNIKDNIFTQVFNGSEKFSGSLEIQDVGKINPLALMLQTGYVTLRKRQKSDESSKLYLTVPNREVGMTIMNNYADSCITPLMSSRKDIFNSVRTREFCNAFCQGQLDRAEELLQGFLSVIPYRLHGKMESFYHSILLSIFKISDWEVDSEHNIAGGIIDLLVTAPDNSIFVTEIKYAKSDDMVDASASPASVKISDKDKKKLDSCITEAFRQIIKNGYLIPYVGNENPVSAVAVAVCGRYFVRIRSIPAEELLKRAHEFLSVAELEEIAHV
ncbi:MAG: AAA family ATPase [Deltaproteobacteria bacterium]|nr:AAA family ATPase [Deltaproteobacteria bacterium]